MIEKDKLAQMIDHTNLKPYATKDDFRILCEEARENHFRMVAINSYPVKMCKEFLKGSDVHVGAAIAFPLGQMSIEAKVAETEDAIANGCDEIDYVLNISRVKEHDYDYIEREMRAMKEVCENRVLLKVIFENCYLTKEEIKACAEVAKKVRPDFIKTSTGFGSGGAGNRGKESAGVVPKIEVDYVRKKELKRVPGAAPGFVIYHTNYSIMIEPRDRI